MLSQLTSHVLRWRYRRAGRNLGVRRAVVCAWLPSGEVVDVSATPGHGYYALPSVHPDGASVVFHGGTSERCRIWRASPGDGRAAPITPERLVACSPSFSWDGDWIVFSGYDAAKQPSYSMEDAIDRFPGVGLYFGGAPNRLNVYVMKSDGSGLRQITTGPYSDTRPAFSPDGTHVVFLRRGRRPWGPREMWRVPADGGGEPEALLRDVSAGRPSYSADGASIYFFSDSGGRARLATIPSQGGRWRFVPNDTVGHWSHGPVCDPDGRHLWYHCGIDGGSLCKLPLDGGEPKVMKPPGFERRACAHASVSRNGVVAFDWVEYVKRDPQ